MTLRPYQTEAINAISRHWDNVSKRVILRLPTGGGKTTVFCELMKTWSFCGFNVLMVVRGRKLVSQAAERLEREGVDFNILMAGEKEKRPHATVSLASIDTLRSRKLAPPADLIVIDEVHTARSHAFDWLFSHYPGAYFLGVTATPYNRLGFKPIADAIIEVVRVPELIAQGYLVPGKYFAPDKPDLSSVKKSGGDFIVSDLSSAMNQARLRGPIVETWKRLGENRPTLLFGVDVNHSRSLASEFTNGGVPSAHIDSACSPEERSYLMDALCSGRISVLCSVGVLTTGVDLPPVSCLIIARPTLSLAMHQQILGRGTRPFPGKSNMLVLDHAGNLERHGFYEDYREAGLDGKPKPFRVVTNTCKKCFCIWIPTKDPSCPGLYPDGSRCGYVNPIVPPKPRRLITDESAVLLELDPVAFEARARETWITETARECAERGYKMGAAFYKIKSRYGDSVAKASWGKIREAFKAEE